ncbi:hypothetical protein VDG1235_4571 [Verrucomicrobiia bacterium DG1235]|nr:hypothetical protein VDG1235_4571 [Verrucomicrobiae bacterium DG1235]
MSKRGKYLALSFLVHLLGIWMCTPFFFGDIEFKQSRNENSNTIRRETIKLAVALNSMAKAEQLLSGKSANQRKLAISYEEMTKLPDSEIAKRALTLRKEITRLTDYKSRESNNVRSLAARSASREQDRIMKIAQHGDRPKLVSEIEMMATESRIAANSLNTAVSQTNRETKRDLQIVNNESQSRGTSGMNLIDTLRIESMSGSRFLEIENETDAWSYINSWYVLGPIAKGQAPESENRIDFDLDLDLPIRGKANVYWEYEICDGPALALSKNEEQQTYFLYSELFAAEEQEVVLCLRSTDNARLWVNQNPVPAIEFREKERGESVCIATLNRGYNSLELRVDSNGPNGYLWLAHSSKIAKAIAEL